MRITTSLLVATLTLLPAAAAAQGTAPAQTTASPATSGTIDFGVRGTTSSGDAARYERYRDLGDGFFFENLRVHSERNNWVLDFLGTHAGRRDQRFSGSFVRPGRFKGWAVWDQIPMLMSETTRTLFSQDFDDPQAVLTIPEALRTQVQANAGANPVVAVVPGLFAENARTFDTRSRRDTLRTGFEYIATNELTVRGQFQSTGREGTLPYGASFGHGALVEFPAPIDHRLNDFETNAEFTRGDLLVRGGYTGSWFTNEATVVTVDNPFRAFDSTSAPARGGLSLAPSNSYFTVNGMLSYRLPRKSRVTAFVSVGSLKDAGDALMSQTVNTANTPLPLARTTVEGEARTTAFNLNFSSRPNRYLDVSARFRSYDYDNRTPEFAMTQRVAYDNSPGNATMSTLGGTSYTPNHDGVSGVLTEPFGVARYTFDGDVRLSPWSGMSVGGGYSRIQEDRSHRFFEKTTENLLRLTFDTIGNQWFTLRTKYEYGQKRGDVTEEWEEELFDIGEQPFIRHFDIAQRDRNRITLTAAFTPTATMALNASVAAGKDDYIESEFGLRDNTHRVYSLGADLMPSEMLSFGASYSFEKYAALSRSRQASPPGSTQAKLSFEAYLEQARLPGSAYEIADARRNWAVDSADRAHSVILFAGVNKIRDKVDVEFSYDFNRARATYDYITGPVADRTLPEEVIIDSTLPVPTQLPPVKSSLQRGTLDVVYALTDRVGVGLSYWHERYRVNDFTLDAESTPNLARTNAVLLGYLYRPYTANTVWGRLLVRF